MDFKKARFNMIEQQIRPWDVLDFDILDALDEIPRELFVRPEQLGYAYADMALPLENGGTMLEPKMVARMAQALKLKKTERVLEVGTGSGYATALLSKMAQEVITCDVDEHQLLAAKSILNRIGVANVRYTCANGLNGLSHDASFDAIYIGGSLPEVPENLLQQLTDGGRMVVVVGSKPVQHCLLITRAGDAFTQKSLFETLITPLQAVSVRDNWYQATGKFQF